MLNASRHEAYLKILLKIRSITLRSLAIDTVNIGLVNKLNRMKMKHETKKI